MKSCTEDLAAARLLACGALLLLASCAGRSEYLTGMELDRQGDLRGAYRHFYRAVLSNPGHRVYSGALERTGRSLALERLDQGMPAEAAGDLDEALDWYTTAWEYDPEGVLPRCYWDRVRSRMAEEPGLFAGLEGWRESGEWEALLGALRAEPRLALQYPVLADWPARALIVAAGRLLDAVLLAEAPAGDPRALWESSIRLLDGLGRMRSQLLERPWADADGLARRLGELEPVLEETARGLGSQLRAFDLIIEAEKREAAGGYEGALDLFRAALRQSIESPRARDGAHRALARWIAELDTTAAISMSRGEWEQALEQLRRIQTLKGEEPQVEMMIQKCRQKLWESWIEKGFAYRDRGLPGLALVSCLEARRVQPPTPALAEEERRLERAVIAQVVPPLDVDLLAAVEGEVDFDAELWGIRGELILGLEERVRRCLRRRLPDAVAPAAPSGGAGVLRIRICDIDFHYVIHAPVVGMEDIWTIESLIHKPNPVFDSMERELVEAGEETGELLGLVRPPGGGEPPASGIGPDERLLAEDRMRLSEARVKRISTSLNRVSRRIPEVVWRRQIHPVSDYRLEALLETRIQIDGDERWLAVSDRAEDRVVEGEMQWGIPPDPLELPSREDIFRRLEERLAEELAGEALRAVERRALKFQELSRERLRSRAFDLALENLITYCFGCRELARVPGASPEACRDLKESLETIRKIGGYDLEALWSLSAGG